MIRALIFFLLAHSPAFALDLVPPGAVLAAQSQSAADSVRLPVEPWNAAVSPPQEEGSIRKSAYRIANSSVTTLQLMAPLRVVLELAGYETVFSCADAACGGFDFRFQLDLLPAPDMHVDLGNYRYVLMQNPAGEPHSVSIVTSTSSSEGFVHVTEVSKTQQTAVQTTPQPQANTPTLVAPVQDTSGLIEALLANGSAVLADLEFKTGSAELDGGPYQTLAILADWLNQTPNARIVLVGHSDAVGSLEANAALSRRRAASVLAQLTDTLGVRQAQVASAGAGALSPLASNLSDAGRALNRRVEVVLLSLE